MKVHRRGSTAVIVAISFVPLVEVRHKGTLLACRSSYSTSSKKKQKKQQQFHVSDRLYDVCVRSLHHVGRKSKGFLVVKIKIKKLITFSDRRVYVLSHRCQRDGAARSARNWGLISAGRKWRHAHEVYVEIL